MAEYNNENRGVAFPNDYKKEDKHPDYKGKGNFNGVDFEFGIWERTSPKGRYLSFSFSEPYEPEDRNDDSAKNEMLLDDDQAEKISLDDIPF